MNPQLFIDSLVAVNFSICLALWVQFTLWTWRSGELPVQKRQIYLGLALFFPLMLVISLSHASWVPMPEWLERVEWLLAIAIGPMLFDFIYGRFYQDSCLPQALTVAVLSGGALWITQPMALIVLPALFTLAAVAICIGRLKSGLDRLVLHALAVALIVHVAQLLRFLYRDIPWFEELVPITAALLGLVYSTMLLLPRAEKKIKRPASDGDAEEAVFEAVEDYLRKTQAYRDPEFCLASLASALGLPAYLVSQAINCRAGRFNDYINNLRIRQFIASDEGDDHVQDLAYSVGFNSRSAFYRAFKGLTGETPSQYRSRPRPDLQIGT